MTAQPIDFRSAQHIATELVKVGLDAAWTIPFVEHGHEHYAKDVRVHHKPGSIDGLLTFTAVDDATGQAIAVTVQVSAVPLPAVDMPTLRLAGEPTDPGSVIRAGVK